MKSCKILLVLKEEVFIFVISWAMHVLESNTWPFSRSNSKNLVEKEFVLSFRTTNLFFIQISQSFGNHLRESM